MLLFSQSCPRKSPTEMDMIETGVNMINMTGKVNDKLRRRKLKNSVLKNKPKNELEAIQ